MQKSSGGGGIRTPLKTSTELAISGQASAESGALDLTTPVATGVDLADLLNQLAGLTPAQRGALAILLASTASPPPVAIPSKRVVLDDRTPLDDRAEENESTGI